MILNESTKKGFLDSVLNETLPDEIASSEYAGKCEVWLKLAKIRK